MAGPLLAYSMLYLFRILGKRWNVPIMEYLYSVKGEAKFNDLYGALEGVTPKNLSNGLKELVKADLVGKKVTNEGNMVRTSYALTRKGQSVMNLLYHSRELAYVGL